MKFSPNPQTTKDRADYAIRVMLRRGNTSRTFCSCFENGDGDQVSATIWKRALKNEKLMAVLPKYLVPELAKSAYDRYTLQTERKRVIILRVPNLAIRR